MLRHTHTHTHTKHPIGNLSSLQSNCASELFCLFTIYKHSASGLCKFDYSVRGLETSGSGWGPVVRPSELGDEDSTSTKSAGFLTR
jgi:hypothetical protein